MMWDDRDKVWGLVPSLCTKIFKRSVLIDVMEMSKSLNLYYGEDAAIIYPYMLRVSSASITHKSFYYHRQRKNGEIPPYFLDNEFYDKVYKLYCYFREIFETNEYNDMLLEELEKYYVNCVNRKSQMTNKKVIERIDYFPFNIIGKNKKIILYGAGKIGCQYKKQNDDYNFTNIIMWVDKNKAGQSIEGMRISSVNSIKSVEYDYILISVKNYYLVKSIMDELCIQYGVDKNQIKWAGE